MADALVDIILHGREERNIEYKESVPWGDADIKAKLTRAALAMSNIRDGGYIVIGVEQAGDAFTPTGMKQEDFDSFNQDHVSAHINNYADPFAEVTVTKQEHEGNRFVIIQVAEFSEIPVICKRDGLRLRHGAMYTRSRRMNESVEVPTSAEMREIMEAAIEKGFRRLLATLRRAGAQVAEIGGVEGKRFDDELEGL